MHRFNGTINYAAARDCDCEEAKAGGEVKNQPDVNYESNDVVLTPALLAKKIIEHFPLKGRVLDPCRGAGARGRTSHG